MARNGSEPPWSQPGGPGASYSALKQETGPDSRAQKGPEKARNRPAGPKPAQTRSSGPDQRFEAETAAIWANRPETGPFGPVSGPSAQQQPPTNPEPPRNTTNPGTGPETGQKQPDSPKQARKGPKTARNSRNSRKPARGTPDHPTTGKHAPGASNRPEGPETGPEMAVSGPFWPRNGRFGGRARDGPPRAGRAASRSPSESPGKRGRTANKGQNRVRVLGAPGGAPREH